MVRWNIEKDGETKIVLNLWYDTLSIDSSNEMIYTPTITGRKFLRALS